MTEAEKEKVRIRAGLTQNEIAAYQSGLQERTMNLPNLTELLEKATERPWERDATFIFAPGSSGFSNAPDGANIAAASELRASTCVQYDRPYSGSENLKEIFANARFLVLAANNFGAVVYALAHVTECQLCSEGTFFKCEHGVDVDALLAKIEREAGL